MYPIIKRCIDRIVAACLLVCLLPIYIGLTLLIGFTMGWPALFKQERSGYKNKIFTVYKFRTMNQAKDAQGQLLPDHDRLTSLGRLMRKLSLDEIPQLLNVVKGEMSFIGPRPLLLDYVPLYSAEQNRRHDVTPGITGWAQVNGRNTLNWQEKFALDVYYVDHQSLWLDIKIVWLTLYTVCLCKDINASQTTTMEPFKGNTHETT